MNGWEGQVLAIAVKELIEAAKTLGRDGFGFRKDKTLLSAVIRDLLTQNPNVPRAQAALKQVESLGTQPSDYYVAKQLLAKVLPPSGEGRSEGRGSPALVAAFNDSRSNGSKKPTLREHTQTRSAFPAGEVWGEGSSRTTPRWSHSLLDRRDGFLRDHREDSSVRLSARDPIRRRPRDNS